MPESLIRVNLLKQGLKQVFYSSYLKLVQSQNNLKGSFNIQKAKSKENYKFQRFQIGITKQQLISRLKRWIQTLTLQKNFSLKYKKSKERNMNQYRNNGGSSTSKSRATGFKSPSAHETLDAKAYKKKYQKKVQQLMKQRQRSQQLQQMLEQMRQKLQKQDKQLHKKQQIEDVLLMQINQLKNQIESTKSNKTLSKQNSIQQKRSLNKRSYEYSQNNSNSQMSQLSQNSGTQGKSGVNGYNFTLSDLNNQGNNSYQSEYSQKQYSQSGYQHNLGSNLKGSSSVNNMSEQNSASSREKGQVGGYFGSIFNK